MPPVEIEKGIAYKKKFYSALPDRKGKGKVGIAEAAPKDGGNKYHSSSGSHYLPGDAETSEDDEEAAENKKRYKEFNIKLKSGDSFIQARQ